MPTLSAGLLLYRYCDDQLQVLLVHPGGPFWRAKDDGAWSIPKGEHEADEEPLAAAIREFGEETGSELTIEREACRPLMPIKQPSGKIISAWALEADLDVSAVRSNTFEMEWPPHSGSIRRFPEIDRAEWFTVFEAARKIHAGQLAFLQELEDCLAYSGGPPV